MHYRNAVLIVVATIVLFTVMLVFLPVWRVPSVYTGIVSSNAMAPLLLPTDVVLVNKLAYVASRPAHGDVVMYIPPIAGKDVLPVGRVIAIPGDRLPVRSSIEMNVHDYGIYVAGPHGTWKRIDPGLYNIPPKSNWVAPERLPVNCYIVLGDNKRATDDSRRWGCVQRNDFLGRVVRIIAPAKRVRTLAPDDLRPRLLDFPLPWPT